MRRKATREDSNDDDRRSRAVSVICQAHSRDSEKGAKVPASHDSLSGPLDTDTFTRIERMAAYWGLGFVTRNSSFTL